MEIHCPANAPHHVHGCYQHLGGSTGEIEWNGMKVIASYNPIGVRKSDACFWDVDHDAAFKTRWAPSYGEALRTGAVTVSTAG